MRNSSRVDGRGEDRFERALLALADDGVGGEDGGDDGREDQHVEQGEPDAVHRTWRS